jgi:hypothetical protein
VIRTLTCLAAAVVLSAACAAAATASWTAPVAVSPLGQKHTTLSLAFDDDGVLRPIWAQGRTLRVATVRRSGAISRRLTAARMRDPNGGTSLTHALAGGRTMLLFQAGASLRIRTIDGRGRTLATRTVRGGSASIGSSPYARLAGSAVLACWMRQTRSGRRYDMQVQAAVIRGDGTIGSPVTIAEDAGETSVMGDCSVAASGPHGLVQWAMGTPRRDTQIFVRRISPAGVTGAPIPVMPAAQPLVVNGGEPYVDVTSTGRIVASWLASDAQGRGRRIPGTRWLRWISAADMPEPPAVIETYRDAGDAEFALHAIGEDRAVLFSAPGRGVSAAIADGAGTITPPVRLFDGPAYLLSTDGNGREVALGWQSVQRRVSSVYATRWSVGGATPPERLARGGAPNWPSWPLAAINARGDAAVVYNVSANRFPFRLGVRAAFGP